MATLSTCGMVSASFLAKKPPPPAAGSLRAISRVGQEHFGLRSGGKIGRMTCMVTHYKVKLVTPQYTTEFDCLDTKCILDQAEEMAIDIPYSCRNGSCSACTGKVVAGTVDQSDGSYLDYDQMEAGYVLTCVACPTSDVVIETHKEDELNSYLN